MPDSREKRNSRVQHAAQPRAGKPAPTAEQVSDLAWAGQHAQAVELATAALATTGLSVGCRLDLLDLRAEGFIAQGDLDSAKTDADRMLDLADRARTAAFKAQARNRLALVQMRKGEFKAAVASATAALKAARQSKQVPLEAMSLFRLAEAQFDHGELCGGEREKHAEAEEARQEEHGMRECCRSDEQRNRDGSFHAAMGRPPCNSASRGGKS